MTRQVQLNPRAFSTRSAWRLRAGTTARAPRKTYIHWIKRLIHFHGMRHPREMGASEVTAFLNHLARDLDVAAATQNQALAAILFLYKEVLNLPLPWLEGLERALHNADLASGYGDVELPDALSRKHPGAPYEWGWKVVFPSHKLSTDPGTGVLRRHHVYEN